MITILSPAKSLNFKSETQTQKYSEAQFANKSVALIKELKKYSPDDLRKLMKISDGLGELNFIRYQNWKTDHTLGNSRQAILAFNGEVYNGLQALTLSEKEIDFAQNNVRILSGLYGILRPLDLIQPYRLEMGTKLKTKNYKDLYNYWDESLAKKLQEELLEHKHPYIINLASNEYSKAVHLKKFDKKVITPVFKEYKNDTYKVITVYAKKARGLMTRFILDNAIENPEEIKTFDIEGYGFSQELSNENEWVFTR